MNNLTDLDVILFVYVFFSIGMIQGTHDQVRKKHGYISSYILSIFLGIFWPIYIGYVIGMNIAPED